MRKSLAESRGLLWQLLLSGMMKGGGGLLTFVCFIFIARSAAVDEYGLFSITLLAASLLCCLVVGGQRGHRAGCIHCNPEPAFHVGRHSCELDA